MVLIALLLACGADSGSPGGNAPPPEVVEEGQPTRAEAWAGLGDEAARTAWLMQLGQTVYASGNGGIACQTCHREDGQGTRGAFPPLVGQQELMGDCATTAGYVLNGLTGPMKVDGIQYTGVMPKQGHLLDDYQIAAVITYVRNSWGNDYGPCTPDQVQAVRGQ